MYRFSSRILQLVLSVAFAGIALMPAYASAAVITLNNATASSSNASTTLAKIGDTVSFSLSLSGTPSATTTPVINIFGFGSTSMAGSGAAWTYSTTSASAWTEGAVPFMIGWGGSLGESTTTFQSVASTTLVNVVFDKTAPTIQTAAVSSTLNASTTLAKIGDVITISFLASEPLKTPSVTLQGNTATVLATTTLARFWTASTTVNSGDASGAVTFSITPVDQAGNASSTAQTTFTTPSLISVYSHLPQITLSGGNPDATDQSTQFTYTDPGASAIDALLKALTVSPSGTVDRTKTGAYTITYAATDVAGNTNSATRTVNVNGIGGHSSGSGGGGGGGSAHTTVYTQTTPTTSSVSVTTTPVTPTSFTRSLRAGITGADVKALQQWLNAHGYAIASSGPGSTGNETLYFGLATKAALAKFQAAVGISPAAGFFGPLTRAYIAAHS